MSFGESPFGDSSDLETDDACSPVRPATACRPVACRRSHTQLSRSLTTSAGAPCPCCTLTSCWLVAPDQVRVHRAAAQAVDAAPLLAALEEARSRRRSGRKGRPWRGEWRRGCDGAALRQRCRCVRAGAGPPGPQRLREVQPAQRAVRPGEREGGEGSRRCVGPPLMSACTGLAGRSCVPTFQAPGSRLSEGGRWRGVGGWEGWEG